MVPVLKGMTSYFEIPLGSNNPPDRALQDKLKGSNVDYVNNSNSSYMNIEGEKDEPNVLSNLRHH